MSGDVWLFVTFTACEGDEARMLFWPFLRPERVYCIFKEEERHSVIVFNQFYYLHIIST